MESFNHETGQFIQIDDARIYFEIIGEDNRPVILLLHGGFGTIEDFKSIIPDLIDRFRIVGIDSRGHGRSTYGSKELTYEILQHDVEKVLEYLKITPLAIIGFSDGGIVAYRLATFSSLNVKKLITIGSRWHLKDAQLTKDLFLKITPESWKTKFPATFELYQKLNPAPDFNHLATSLIKMWLDENTSGYPNEAVKEITSELLVVRGNNDHLLSIESIAELLKLVKNAAFLNIPFAGHMAFEEQKDIFMLAIDKFLNGPNA